MELELALIIWSKIQPTCTSKNLKRGIIWLNFVKFFQWCSVGNNFIGCTVYEESTAMKVLS
jgi:hypothetical protein